MTRAAKRLLGGVAVLAVVAAGAGVAINRWVTSSDGGAAAPLAAAIDPRDPQLRDPEKARLFFAAVADGEQRALARVEQALAAARKSAAAPATIAKLEQARRDYVERIRRHRAVADAPAPAP